MKKLNLIYGLLLCAALASCKKDNVEETTVKPSKDIKIAAVSDSVSYTIDGITYTAGGLGLATSSQGGQDANRTLSFPDPNNKHIWGLAGNPDSLLSYQTSKIYSNSAFMSVVFLKRFKITPEFVWIFPPLKDELSLFAVGKHDVVEDFGWQNAHDGIAIDVRANNKLYTSYNAYDGPTTVVMPAGFQKDSKFEIVSLVDAKSGFNLEAKFTATVIDPATGEKKQLTNGYLRLNFSPVYALPKNK